MKTIKLTMKTVESYAKYLYQEGRSRGTIEKYRRDTARFVRFIQSQSIWDRGSVRAWRDKLVEEQYSASTVNGMVTAVNGLMEFIGCPDFRAKPIRCQRKIFRAEERELTREEYMRLLQTAQHQGKHRRLLVMETICATGIRVSELEHITVGAVEKGRAVVHCKGKERIILLPAKLCTRLRKWIKERGLKAGPVFVTEGGLPLNRSNIWRDMKRLCEDAGVAPGKVFPHNLRHLFARLFYALEKDIAKLADVLGHSSIGTTRFYIMETGTEHERLVSRLRLVL